MPDDCVFCKIGAGEIPVAPIYEDDEFLAFPDLNKQAPEHALVIPKAHYPTLPDIPDCALLGRLLAAANETARRLNLAKDGYRIVVNVGDDGGQTVYHVHVHVLGGRFMQWPPG